MSCWQGGIFGKPAIPFRSVVAGFVFVGRIIRITQPVVRYDPFTDLSDINVPANRHDFTAHIRALNPRKGQRLAALGRILFADTLKSISGIHEQACITVKILCGAGHRFFWSEPGQE